MRLLTRFYLLTLPPLVLLGGLMAYHAKDVRQQELERSVEQFTAANLQTTRLLAANHLFQEFLILNRSFPNDSAMNRLKNQVETSLKELLASSKGQSNKTEYIALLDSRLRPVAVQSQDEFYPSSEFLAKLSKTATDSELIDNIQFTSLPIRYDLNNNGRLEARETFGTIRVGYQLPLDDIRQQHATLLKQELFVLSMCIGLLVLLIFMVGRSIANPLAQLAEQAQEASSDLTGHFSLDRAPREVLVLARALQKMMRSLGINQSELEASRNTLKSQLEFQQKLIDTVRVPIFYKDPHGNYIGCNHLFATMVGLPKEAILGQNALDLFDREIANEHTDIDQQLLSEGGSRSYHSRLPCSDGSIRQALVHKSTYLDEHGQVQGLIGAYLDYTELKQVQDELSEQKQLLRTILDLLPVHVYWKDLEERYRGANLRFAEDIGVDKPDALIGKRFSELKINFNGDEPVSTTDRAILETGQPSLSREVQLHYKGENHTLFSSKVPLTDDDGQVIGLLGVNVDISELKKVQQELQHKTTLLRNMLDHLPVAIYWKGRDLLYEGGNREFARLMRLESTEQIAGKHLQNFDFDDESTGVLDELDRRVLNDGISVLMQEINLEHLGTLQTRLISKVPLKNDQGQVDGLLGISMDITGRRKTERALAEQGALLRDILETIPANVYWKDSQLTYQGGNRHFARAIGLKTPDDLIGQTSDILPYSPQIKAQLLAMDHAILKEGQPIFDQELDLLTEQGLHTVLLSKVPLKDLDGQVVGILGISSDITPRKEVERALTRSESLLRNILENLPSMLFVKQAETLEYIEVNRAGTELMGLSRSELIGKTDAVLFPDNADFFSQKDHETLAHGLPVEIEKEWIRTRNKGDRWLHTRKVPLFDEAGQPVYLLGISEDITEKKETAERLLQKTRTLEQLLDNLPVAVYWKDTDSRYLTANRYFRQLHNLSEEDFVEALPLSELAHPPQVLNRIREEDLALLKTGKSVVTECHLNDQEGRARVFLTQKVPVHDDRGQIIGLLGIDADITERINAEQALQQAYDQLEVRVDERTADLQQAMARLQNEISIRQRAEEALTASEARFRNLYNHTPVLMLSVAQDNAIVSVNDYLLETLGFNRAELLGEDYHCLLSTAKTVTTDFTQALHGGEPIHDLPVRLNGGNGLEIDVLVTTSVDSDAPSEHPQLIVAMIDITERMRAENRLRETLEQLEELNEIVNHSPAVAFLWKADENWPVQYVSENVRQFGYEPEELLAGKTHFYDMIHPDDLGPVQQEVAQLTAEGKTEFRQEYRLVQPDGTVHWVDDRTWVRRDQQGQATHYQGLVLDITEQRLAEQRLRETLARLEDLEYIVNHSPAVAFLCRDEPGWPVEFVSSNVSQFGFTSDQFLEDGLPYDVLIHPEDLQRVNREVNEWTESGKRNELLQSYRLVCADGQIRWIDDWNWFRRDEEDNITHIQGLILDVTEQHNAQLELQRVSDDLSRLISTANTPIIGVDHQGLINEWNLQAEEVTGYSRQEVMGTDPLDLMVVEGQRRRIRKLLSKALQGIEVKQFELSLINRQQQQIETLFNFTSRLDEHGKVIGVVGLGQDITTRKQAEQALQKARDRAEEANRAKSNFLATMSHEIRTPMNAIIGMTELTLQAGLDPVQAEYLESICQSTHHLLNLVNDILDFSKIEAGKLELEAIPFSLSDILHNIARTQGIRAWQKNLFLDLSLADTVPDHLCGDPGRLQQVLYNLTENALKFTKKLGISIQIELATAAEATACGIDASLPADLPLIHFRVLDAGIGIAHEDQPKIFGSFQQSDSSTTRKYGGTGLGLAICKELVEAMGGKIWVVSEPEIGSCFQFIVPLKQASEATSEPRPKSEPRNRRKTASATLLVAEDNPMNLKVASHFLSNLGYDLLIAENGAQALDLLRDEEVDLVLMDIEMPQMDGIEATRRLRRGDAGPRNKDIPVLALTAHAFEGYREHCLSQGMDDFLTKPLDFNQLSDLLRYWLHHHKSSGGGVPSPTVALDTQEALRRLEGDTDLLQEVRGMFLKELPTFQKTLRRQIQAQDWHGLEMTAHSLKAPSAMIGANRISQLSRQLEKAASQQADERCREFNDQLLKALSDIAPLLNHESS